MQRVRCIIAPPSHVLDDLPRDELSMRSLECNAASRNRPDENRVVVDTDAAPR